MSRLEVKLAGLAAMASAGLKLEWERVYKAPAPRLSADLLRMGIAYRLQERSLGKLSAAAARSLVGTAPAPTMKPGTQLVRTWNKRDVIVLVTEDGFLFDGKPYRSLTAIAKEVTGAVWSGPRFFGLTGDV